MKLSEAIRLGAMLHPQTFGRTYEHDADGKIMASCAVGAAIQAGFALPIALVPMTSPCPDCGEMLRYSHELQSLIVHLNDDHDWTRERIADYVETVERERQPADEVAPATNAVREDCESPVLTTRA